MNIEQFNELTNIINMFSDAIPDNIDEKLELGDLKISISKRDGKVELNVESKKEEFNDSEIKETTKEFRERLKELDDQTFMEVVEEIKDDIDMQKFDKLLNLESYNEESANEVTDLMNQVSKVICNKLQDKIQELVNIYDKF